MSGMSEFSTAVQEGLFLGHILSITGSQSVVLSTSPKFDGSGNVNGAYLQTPATVTGLQTYGSSGVDRWTIVVGGGGFKVSSTLAAGQNSTDVGTIVPVSSGTLTAQLLHVSTVYGAYMDVEAWSNILTFNLQNTPYAFPFNPNFNADSLGGVCGQSFLIGNPQSPQTGSYLEIQLFKDLEISPFQTVNVDTTKRLQPFKINPVGQVKSLQVRISTVNSTAGLDLSRFQFRIVSQPKAGV